MYQYLFYNMQSQPNLIISIIFILAGALDIKLYLLIYIFPNELATRSKNTSPRICPPWNVFNEKLNQVIYKSLLSTKF